jgi:protease I
VRNAGANVGDLPAVTDGTIVTSRKPDDVEPFTNALIALVEKSADRAENRETSEMRA